MRQWIVEPKQVIAEFVAKKIGITPDFGNFNAIAQIDEKGIVAAVIYNSFSVGSDKRVYDCSMHVAARDGVRWATREFLHHAFYYPFVQLGCNRVTGLVHKKDKKVRKFDEHLGFEFEACIKRATEHGDMIIYRMFKENCKWINIMQEKIDPKDIIPVNDAWNEEKLNILTASMKQQGWTGAPILVLNRHGKKLALTGSHRIKAAEQAGITVPVKYVDTKKVSDVHLAQLLRACGDAESAYLLEAEIFKSGAA